MKLTRISTEPGLVTLGSMPAGSLSLNTRDWSVAAATVHEWEAAREIGGKRLEIPSIKEAISRYLEE